MGGQGRDTETWRDLRRVNPPQADKDLGAGRGQHMGGAHRHRNGDRHSHMAWGAGTSGGRWRVAGAGKSQVFGASHQEWRGGAGEKRVILRGTAADGEAVGKREGKIIIMKY